MRRINVVKGSDVPLRLEFYANGLPLNLERVEDDDYFLLKLFYKSGEILATYDSRQVDYTGILIPEGGNDWISGVVDIYMHGIVTNSAKEGDIYYQLRNRTIDPDFEDNYVDAYSQEEYLFTIVRAI